MSFREQLTRKMEIDAITRAVLATIGPPGSEKKVDREAARRLLAFVPYHSRRERDLELYIREEGDGPPLVLVLDNELALYRTAVTDVVMRKSPTIKEMVKLRNALRILNDKDVVLSKREDTVNRLRTEGLARLDLSYTRADLEDIASDGAASLENGYAEGVTEALDMLGEILGLRAVPKELAMPHRDIRGRRLEGDAPAFSPLVLFDRIHHRLFFMESPIRADRRDQVEGLRRTAAGEREPDAEGRAVFDRLVQACPARGALTP